MQYDLRSLGYYVIIVFGALFGASIIGTFLFPIPLDSLVLVVIWLNTFPDWFPNRSYVTTLRICLLTLTRARKRMGRNNGAPRASPHLQHRALAP